MPSPLTVNTTSSDGYVAVNSANWPPAHDALTGSVYSLYQYIAGRAYKAGSNYSFVDRGWIPFNTSSIGADSTITGASLRLVCYDKTGTGQITRVVSTSVTSLVSASYAQANWGTAIAGSFTAAAVAGTGYDVALDTTIITINKTGTTYIGLRGANDITDTVPSGNNHVTWYSGNSINAPALTVTYTEPPQTKTVYHPQMTRMIVIPRQQTATGAESQKKRIARPIANSVQAQPAMKRLVSFAEQFSASATAYISRIIQTSIETATNSIIFTGAATVSLVKEIEYRTRVTYKNAVITAQSNAAVVKRVFKSGAANTSGTQATRKKILQPRVFPAVGNNDSYSGVIKRAIAAGHAAVARRREVAAVRSYASSGTVGHKKAMPKVIETAVSASVSRARAMTRGLVKSVSGSVTRTSLLSKQVIRRASAVLFIWSDIFRITLGQLISSIRRRNTL